MDAFALSLPRLRFDSTYEGLKPERGRAQARARGRFDSTYEGLKLIANELSHLPREEFRQYL